MRALRIGLATVAGLAAAFAMSGCADKAKAASPEGGGRQSAVSPSGPTDTYLQWPFPARDQKYRVIDGKHIWQYVVQQAAIAEHYRDNGHPQFWGRITGTSGDAEDAQWLLSKFRQIGLSDTHLQPVDMFLPQWAPQSWDVSVGAGGKTIQLTSAQPPYGGPDTGGKVLDLEAVYVGLGSEADFAGHDVRGKAVLIFRSDIGHQIAPADVLKRAQEKGAAAIFGADFRGANYNMQAYRAHTNVPTFSLGTQDGETVRDLIANAPAGSPPHIRIRMDAKWVPNQKTALVWGTLPGVTDETIYVIAHRDGWFDAGGDNASGVASMLGLAEYFAKVPKSQRRRTMIFLGEDGHHQISPGEYGEAWLVANRAKFFSKTALLINDEHVSEVVPYAYGRNKGWTNTTDPRQWYAGGSSRPQLEKVAVEAFREFGVPLWLQPTQTPPGGDLGPFYWFVPGVVAQSNTFFYMHTTGDTPDNVPWTGLEATTRAYAKIIDEVNTIPLKDLQRPPEAHPRPEDELDLTNCAAWVEDSSSTCQSAQPPY